MIRRPPRSTLSLHDALPIYFSLGKLVPAFRWRRPGREPEKKLAYFLQSKSRLSCALDRKSTRLNSSHITISYAVFCLKKKKTKKQIHKTQTQKKEKNQRSMQ